ncbi:hypothetical protein ILYODFUR_035867, partial [Ilyodon furcidens]
LDRASLSAEWSRNRLERNQLEVKLKEEKRRRNRMKSIMQDTATTLRQALKEAPTEQQDVDSVPQWRQLLQNLQELLDRQKLSRSSAEGMSELQKSDLAPTRAESLDPALGLQFQPSRHRAHDSCLVSRPTAKPRASLCRTGATSCSSLIPLHRFVKIKGNKSGQQLLSAGRLIYFYWQVLFLMFEEFIATPIKH